jgi:carboxylate-amine ligase
MNFEKFNNGNHFSIGVELELRILDKSELTLQNEYDYILKNIDNKYKKNLASEFLGSMVEINTPVFEYEKDLILYLKEIISNMNNIISKKNLCLQTSGSYAQKSDNVRLNDNPRYKEIFDEHQVLLEDFSICGTHVHIGFEDFDKALKAYNYSLYYLPLFVALSASSIFHNSINTGIHSYRTKIFDRLPKASIPEYFSSYEDMKTLYDLLYDNKVIKTTKDIWWDVRIQPHFKTLELRVCDAVHDFERLEVIMSLFKAVCQLSLLEDCTKMPTQVLKQNMWSATRYSLSGDFITNNGLLPIKDAINDLIEKSYKKSLLTKDLYNKAKKIFTQKSISEQMIDIYEKTNSLKEVERLGVIK